LAPRPGRRAWLIAGGVLLGLGFIADGLASAYTLANIAARPIVALTRGDGSDPTRVPISAPGTPGRQGEARAMGGEGILFGYAMRYALPDGTGVTCRVRLVFVRCGGEWRAERIAPN
jgi:hypothetical protein